MRRKNRFKQGSIGWKKYQDKLSSINGRNTLAVQLPAQAQPTQVDAPTAQVGAPPAAQSAQSAQVDAPPAAQSAQVDSPPAEQSAQVAMLSACLELSNLSTEVLMSNLNKDVPVADRIYEPMTSTIVHNTGTRDAATECIIALQSCAPFRAHQTQYTSNATDQSLLEPTSFRSTFADYLLTSRFANKNFVGDKPPGC